MAKSPAVGRLLRQSAALIAAANPEAKFHGSSIFEAPAAMLLVLALGATGLISLEWGSAAGGWLMRKLGSWLRGHRVARTNLGVAYPGQACLRDSKSFLEYGTISGVLSPSTVISRNHGTTMRSGPRRIGRRPSRTQDRPAGRPPRSSCLPCSRGAASNSKLTSHADYSIGGPS